MTLSHNVMFLTIIVMIFISLSSFVMSTTDTSHSSHTRQLSPSTLQDLYQADGTMQISRENQLLYVHVPKTGGSTIETSRLFADKPIPASSHFTIDQMTAQEGTSGFVTAATIRHPCDRFVSAWQYTKHDARARGAKSIANKYAINDYDTIDAWVRYLDQHPTHWTKLQRKVVHFTPMTFWTFHNNDTFGIDVVLCQEEWGDGIERLAEVLGRIDNFPPELLVLRHRKTNHTKCASLSTPTIQSIEKAYILDMCVFGYGIFRTKGLSICGGRQMRPREFYNERYRICKKELLSP